MRADGRRSVDDTKGKGEQRGMERWICMGRGARGGGKAALIIIP